MKSKNRKVVIETAVLAKDKISVKSFVVLGQKLFKAFLKHPVILKATPQSDDFSDLSIAFIGAARSRTLNRRYRKKDYATDVLSFSTEAKHQGLGELVLCVPVLKRQAREHRHSFKKEAEMMLVHGFLHLLGYDHEKSHKEELKMVKLQDKLLKKLTGK